MASRCAAVLIHRSRRPPPGQGGFTLLEILLVLAIIAVLATTAVVSFGSLGQSSQVQAEAERLAMTIELVRQKALRRNEVWGLYVDENSYRFKRHGDAGGGWSNAEGRALSPRTAEQGIRFEARSVAPSRSTTNPSPFRFRRQSQAAQPDGGEEGEGDDEEEASPNFAIYPDGAMMPLQIVVSHDGAQPWVAQSDGLERVRALTLSDAETQRPRRWR